MTTPHPFVAKKLGMMTGAVAPATDKRFGSVTAYARHVDILTGSMPAAMVRRFGAIGDGANRVDMMIGERPLDVTLGGLGARDAVREYAKRVNTSVQGLDQEVENEVVSDMTPEELEAKAHALDGTPFAGMNTIGGALQAKADRLRKLNAKRTPTQIKQAQDFYQSWRTFDATWTDFYDKLFQFGITFESPASAWDQVESYETHLSGYRASFAAVTGNPPVTPAPPTSAQIAADHTPPPAPPGAVENTLGLLIKAAAVVVVAGVIVTAVNRSRT